MGSSVNLGAKAPFCIYKSRATNRYACFLEHRTTWDFILGKSFHKSKSPTSLMVHDYWNHNTRKVYEYEGN